MATSFTLSAGFEALESGGGAPTPSSTPLETATTAPSDTKARESLPSAAASGLGGATVSAAAKAAAGSTRAREYVACELRCEARLVVDGRGAELTLDLDVQARFSNYSCLTLKPVSPDVAGPDVLAHNTGRERHSHNLPVRHLVARFM